MEANASETDNSSESDPFEALARMKKNAGAVFGEESGKEITKALEKYEDELKGIATQYQNLKAEEEEYAKFVETMSYVQSKLGEMKKNGLHPYSVAEVAGVARIMELALQDIKKVHTGTIPEITKVIADTEDLQQKLIKVKDVLLLDETKNKKSYPVARTIFFWCLIIATIFYWGIWAAIVMYFAQAFIIWAFDLDGLRKYRFFWEMKK